MGAMPFSKDVLNLDRPAEVARITAWFKASVMGTLKKRGVVIGLSGGIDSSVCAALAVKALGPDKVFGVFMPEHHSASESLELGQLLAKSLGIQAITESIASALEGAGCYARQDEAIRAVFPKYGKGWKSKITLPSLVDSDRLNVFSLTVQSPTGELETARMPLTSYLQLVAATNYKQRVRKMVEYYHADRLNYAVVGTPNRLEYDQGFFVKQGDGTADIKPIAHLYKTQVYALAETLGVPAEIRSRPPTTDTYSLPQSQEEFYFALPYDRMDLCLWAVNHQVPAAEVAATIGLKPDQVERVFKDIASKRRATRYGHLPPLLVEPIFHETHEL